MKMNRGTFRQGYNRLITCYCCKRKTQSQVGHGTDLCQLCFDSASVGNEHLDNAPEYNHDGSRKDCPHCQGVACLHEKRK